MVKININIKKKDLWLLSAIMVFLIGVGYVVAIGSNNYQVQGHDFSELQKCAANQVLKADASGNWQCGSSQILRAVGTTDISAPSAEADMPDMSITLTTSGTKILTMFSAPIWTTLNGEWGYINLYIDEVLKRRQYVTIWSGDDSVSFQHLETGLTPGSHTIRLKWYSGTASGFRQQGSSQSPRTLIVQDLD